MTVARKKVIRQQMRQQFDEWKKRTRLSRPEAKSFSKDLLKFAKLNYLNNQSTFLSKAEFKAIYNLFDGKPKLELLFEGKKHNFRAAASHAACDNKGPTLIVAKTKEGCISGWFTTVDWKSSGSWVKSGSNTWLFKVESPDNVPKYMMKTDSQGLLHRSDYLPSVYPLMFRDRAN